MPGVKKDKKSVLDKIKDKKVEKPTNVKKVIVDITDLDNPTCKFVGEQEWSRRDINTVNRLVQRQYKKWQRKNRVKRH